MGCGRCGRGQSRPANPPSSIGRRPGGNPAPVIPTPVPTGVPVPPMTPRDIIGRLRYVPPAN